jgi:hypothetical protein
MSSDSEAVPARRLCVTWRKGRWSIAHETFIPAITLPRPAVFSPDEAVRRTGFWYEVRDEEGRLLYRHATVSPLAPILEGFRRDGSIVRFAHQPKEAVFFALVPDVDGKSELHIFAGGHAGGAALPAGRSPAKGAKRLAVLKIKRRKPEARHAR